jgi:dCTP deaminase
VYVRLAVASIPLRRAGCPGRCSPPRRATIAIIEAIETGRIRITPPPDLETQLGSVSIDFRLGSTFMVFEHSRHSYIDPRKPQSVGDAMRTIEVPPDEAFIMQPGDFALASTIETLELPDDLVGRLEGRSSIARLGITVHSTAAVFEPGWIGTATMELSNLGRMPVALYPGMRICAFSFEEVSQPVMTPYRVKRNAKYAGQQTPRPSLLADETAGIEPLGGTTGPTLALAAPIGNGRHR